MEPHLTTTDFSSLQINPGLLDNLATLDFHTMTPIQALSLPDILNNRDVIAQAKTGSGKTAAFGLGVLQKLEVKRFRIQALVLCPTRELADQVANDIRKLGRGIHNIKVLTLCGGTPLGPQAGSLEHGAHIIVGTPGRIEDHLGKGTLKLDDVTTLVLDEADRMLDMGFQDSLDNIIEAMPANRQTLLFSATFPEEIQAIAKRVMVDPVMVKAEGTHSADSIEQVFYKVKGDMSRIDALRILLMHYQPESAVVFCNTKRETQFVAAELRRRDFGALPLNGDLEQKDRDQTLVRFVNKSASVLVATDVAARGLDIDALDAVINYDMPREQAVYTHRIGRTGRAGNKGIACTLYTEQESHRLAKLEEYLQQTIDRAPLPGLNLLDKPAYKPVMATLQIDGGKKQKVRPGDILGALTGNKGIDGKHVGKIQIFDNKAYVAVNRASANAALNILADGKIKGKFFKSRLLPT
jgi:ATP-dependent RNA helicase DbpA